MVDLTSGPTVESEGLPGRAFPRLEDSVSPQAYGSELGQGIEKASDVLQNVHDKVQAQARQTQLTAAHVQLQNLSLGLTHDPQTGALAQQGQNAFGLDGKYLPAFDAGAQSIGEGIADPKVKALFQSQVVPQTRQHLSEQLDTHELTQHQEYAAQTAQASIGMAAQTAAANYNHPDIVAANKDTVDFNINALAQQKGWSPEVTAYNLQKAHTEFHSQIVDSMIGQGQLHQAQTYLFQQTANGDVDPKAAEGMQRTIMAQQEHQIAMADKQHRDASNVAIKNLVLLNQNGQLTPQLIEKFHNTLEPAAYEMAYNMLRGKGETSDPTTFSNLYLRAANGEDVRSAAQTAFTQDHTLNQEGFLKVVGNVDASRPGWFKMGVQNISKSITPGELNPDPNIARSRELALQDWDTWAGTHPQATYKEAQDQANILVDHYLIVPQGLTTLQLRAPAHLVGTRSDPVDENGKPDPMLTATVKRLNADAQAGRVTKEEYDAEAKLIARYRKINQAQIDANAKKKPQ